MLPLPLPHTMPKRSTMVVLLVEDDIADQTLVEWAFTYSKRPYTLKIVSDGTEALDYMLRRGKWEDPSTSPVPNVILLDINLPGIEGLSVLEEFKRNSIYRSIPVVMLTTSARESDMYLSARLGARCFWTKPKTESEYIEIIHVIGCFLASSTDGKNQVSSW